MAFINRQCSADNMWTSKFCSKDNDDDDAHFYQNITTLRCKILRQADVVANSAIADGKPG